MGRVYRRGETYWGQWRDERGKWRRKTLATKDKIVARDRLRALELGFGSADKAAHGPTLRAAVSHLVNVVYAARAEGTRNCYETKARQLKRLLGDDTPIGQLDRERIAGYRAARFDEGAAASTIAKEMTCLRLALAEQGIEGVVPKSVIHYRPRTRHLSSLQLELLLAKLAPKRQLWAVVAAYLGPRDAELVTLEWPDVDLRHGRVHIRGTKTGGADRHVPIADALRPWLEVAWRHDGPVLEVWGNSRRDLAAGCKRAGIEPVTANDFRRTFASWLKQAGVDSLTVAHLLGHRSTRMVDLVYGQLTPAVYVAAVGRLPGCATGVPNSASLTGTNGTPGTKREAAASRISVGSLVPRAGIEPATRGFSVRESQVLEFKRRG